MDELRQLQEWYLSQCDGDWEHEYGIELATLDNPGWQLRINLEGTELDEFPFQRVKMLRSDSDWVSCRVENNCFMAACGALNLTETLNLFLQWQRTCPPRIREDDDSA